MDTNKGMVSTSSSRRDNSSAAAVELMYLFVSITNASLEFFSISSILVTFSLSLSTHSSANLSANSHLSVDFRCFPLADDIGCYKQSVEGTGTSFKCTSFLDSTFCHSCNWSTGDRLGGQNCKEMLAK